MEYKYIDNKIIMSTFNSFDIEQILECGQCFRFEKLLEKHYQIIAHNRVLYIKQDISGKNEIEFYPCSKEDFENIWIDYFDLKRDYLKIKEILYANDIVMRDAIDFAPGIRILNQQPFETLISFIISQNNRIPQIKRVIKNISEKYGARIKDTDCFAFPTLSQLLRADIDGLMECRSGFRAKYIMDAVQKLNDESVNINAELSTYDLKRSLMQIKGVGTKVADCVLLFGFGRYEYFPTDVWVKRIMQHFYFNNVETPIADIHEFAFKRYGELAGFAQQYLFHYARQFPDTFLQ